jgi:segregation and condensation protein A
MSFVVKQEAFEGPLDLLLSLIEKRKLFINDISLAKVADDYINHIKQLEKFPIADSANFILIASALLLIKSKSLLPSLPLTDEEQGSIEDLERRLKIYQRMKDLSLHIKERFGKNIIFPKTASRKITPVFSPDESMTVPHLLAAIRSVLRSLPKTEKLAQVVVKKVISLEEMIENLTNRITSSLRMSFKDFSSTHKEDRVNVIVSFLAMLELVKQGIIAVTQEKSFDDIHMETNSIGVPRY